MNTAFMHLQYFLAIMEECNRNGECIDQVRTAIEKDFACYRELNSEKEEMGESNLHSTSL
ncbi:hypothetical protein HZS_3189 [Henneguya salminicola]|nr:hypothetical protein HZS_3189 [Henneguya salminicola]